MRSVVVVLPASMCAMIPMLRVRLRGYSRATTPRPPLTSRSCGLRVCFCCCAASATIESPSVVGEGLVGLSHLVHVLAPLDRGPRAPRGLEDLASKPAGHAPLAPATREVHEPPNRQRRPAPGLHLHGYLVGRAADAP